MKAKIHFYTDIVDSDGNRVDSECTHDDTYADIPHGLYDAIRDVMKTRTCHVGGIEHTDTNIAGQYSDSGMKTKTYIATVRVFNSMEFLTGCSETRTVQVIGVTESTARRICAVFSANA